MKLSLNWVEQVLGRKLNLSPQELSGLLLKLGFEVSSVHHYLKSSGVSVAEILEISKHPNADRLQIARVTDGKETVSVVCGAPNIQTGQKVFWAKVGAVLSGGQVIQETAIRGVKSPGMLCSLKELGLGEDHSGIFSLNEEAPAGTSLESLANLEDFIFDVEVTPNRPDCLSVVGLAREIAAGLNSKGPVLEFSQEARSSIPTYPVEIQNKEGCMRYLAKKFEGVSAGPSPFRVQSFLIRCGIRPINNLVDITNFVLLETGQPLHIFDADKLEGQKIFVRNAKENERILGLDGRTYSLSPDILVIADEKKPVAIAGVMGGQETSVTAQTKNALLESAIFSPKMVRSARRKLNLSTESSYRFERGVSRWSCSAGSSRAELMVKQLGKARLSMFNEVGAEPLNQRPASISVRVSQVEKILGDKIAPSEVKMIFQNFGIPILSFENNNFTVQPPDWRIDLNLEVDYIEEVVRLRGFETIPSKGAAVLLSPTMKGQGRFLLKKKVRALLQSMGFYESCNYGFISKKDSGFFSKDPFLIPLENPLSEDHYFLRPTLLLELLKNLKQNLSYQRKDARLFECGTVFKKVGGQPSEQFFLAAAGCGETSKQNWQAKGSAPIDFFWIKGVLEQIGRETGLDPFRFKRWGSQPPSFVNNLLDPTWSFSVVSGPEDRAVGYCGMVHPYFVKESGLSKDTALFEINLDEIGGKLNAPARKVRPVLRTPFIQRDCSVWIKEEFLWEEVLGEIKKAGGALLEDCALFDVYKDPKQPQAKSISMTFTFRHPGKTLNDETANETRDKILEHLHKKFKAELRQKK